MWNESVSAPFSSTPEMDRIFSLENQLRQMVRFEWALSAALELSQLSAVGSAKAIEPFLDAHFVDLPALLSKARGAGNLAIPLIEQLTAAVLGADEPAAQAIHLGATSQDVLDTAMVLQTREALTAIDAALTGLLRRLGEQARTHASTVLAGRTWLQIGPPTTLGLKIAGWIAALRRHRERIAGAAGRVQVLQFGGAVGTLAALGDKGSEVSSALARNLDLREPLLPWHAHRDSVVEIAAVLGMLTGTLGKMARDISLLMQSEVGELLEPAAEGRGGSSTMPQKRNPVGCAAILAAATRAPGLVATMLSAMVQEHERGLGGWQAEWQAYPEIFKLTASALAAAAEIVAGLEVHPERMTANLESTRGLAMAEAVSIALAAFVGRARAHQAIEQASQRALSEDRHLKDVLMEDAVVKTHLSEAQIEACMNPRNYLGSARRFVDRVIGEPDADR